MFCRAPRLTNYFATLSGKIGRSTRINTLGNNDGAMLDSLPFTCGAEFIVYELSNDEPPHNALGHGGTHMTLLAEIMMWTVAHVASTGKWTVARRWRGWSRRRSGAAPAAAPLRRSARPLATAKSGVRPSMSRAFASTSQPAAATARCLVSGRLRFRWQLLRSMPSTCSRLAAGGPMHQHAWRRTTGARRRCHGARAPP
jgi:hypothetical protein